ncbi:hypothetical protein FEDK69T_26580 [Flavobacterium enshiense DK69]|uniref:T9SS-dependent choice-of-anchor J family protein n=1 Tax=Flavobacterium enshiense TaxID=1341165 RepID=UPI0003C5BFC7|nr:choice-of-anchor J domain-containing protein [Flavobacterium enshiense]ESU21103.1 hypothetical protein FEDK69T_26580 [Flavobacterium enshiense DK69]
MIKKILFSGLLMTALSIHGQNLLVQNFDDMTALPGLGWSSINQSSTVGTVPNWFQGTPLAAAGPFNSYAGNANSYAACNFNSVTGAGTISNWLITPVISLVNGDVITFYTRTISPQAYADRLQLRISANGASSANPSGPTGVGDYTTLALDINPTLVASNYPGAWTQYSYTVSGMASATNCKIAFRYFVENGGPTGVNSDYIGIDSFSVSRTLGTSEFFAENFSVYPNPASNVLNFSVKNSAQINNIQILDLNGRIVKSNNFSAVSEAQINVSDLNAGVYFVDIASDQGKATSKFVKK